MVVKVLVVGSGGREHALAWKLSLSPSVEEVVCAPGNPGTEQVARNVDISVADHAAILHFAQSQSINLVVVGPELPLCKGLADKLRNAGIAVFGPGAAGAELEGSKALSKELMSTHGIPTASYRSFDDQHAAMAYLKGELSFPVVVKASGLAAGKGVIICEDLAAAEAAVESMMGTRSFGQSGETVVIEEFLRGQEVSMHCLTDGSTLLTLPSSQDHKRVFDGDQGPNTGGMGAISPSPLMVNSKDIVKAERDVLFPTVHALRMEARPYRGVLYAGLMMLRSGAKVLEYNVRFGDPETQVILPRMKGDFGELLMACAEGRLDQVSDDAFDWDERHAVTVVLTSGGYPGAFRADQLIKGVEDAQAMDDVFVFHAGTVRHGNDLLTAGGRVLSVTALGKDLQAARDLAYQAVAKISFQDMHYRKDIGAKALPSR